MTGIAAGGAAGGAAAAAGAAAGVAGAAAGVGGAAAGAAAAVGPVWALGPAGWFVGIVTVGAAVGLTLVTAGAGAPAAAGLAVTGIQIGHDDANYTWDCYKAVVGESEKTDRGMSCPDFFMHEKISSIFISDQKEGGYGLVVKNNNEKYFRISATSGENGYLVGLHASEIEVNEANKIIVEKKMLSGIQRRSIALYFSSLRTFA